MNTIIKILGIALILSIGVNLWQYYHPREITSKGKVVYLPGEEKKVIVYDLPDATQSATVKASQEYRQATKEAWELLATVKSIPDLENTEKIASLTKANMQLQIDMDASKMTVNDLEKQKKTWVDKWNTVNVDNSKNTSSVISNVDPIVATVEKREKFYKPKELYTVITSQNPSAKFFGLESYTFKNPRQKDFLELNLKLQGLYVDQTLTPYGGAELLFNPDGKFKPIVGYGYFYKDNKLFPYFLGGLQYNLIRF